MGRGEMRWVGLIARSSLPPLLHICFYLYVGTGDEYRNVLGRIEGVCMTL